MTVIAVTGGRDFNDAFMVDRVMRKCIEPGDAESLVIHGGATGLDTLVERWCHNNGVHYARVPALWHITKPVRSAGPKRNAAMLLLRKSLSYVLAFPGGNGTANMVLKAEAVGVTVVYATDPGWVGAIST